MPKNDNIFVKLQIEKDSQTKALGLTIRFDKNSPNFTADQEGICWIPTWEEIEFIVDAFGMLQHPKTQPMKTYEREAPEPPSTYTSEKTEMPPHHSYEARIAVAPETNETVVEPPSEYTPKQRDNAEKIFVQADERTIDEALKRRKTSEDDYVTNPSDRTVLDRMLKQKKKKE